VLRADNTGADRKDLTIDGVTKAEWSSKKYFARRTHPPIGDYENQSERLWADV
jgi:hypothetical protein